MMASCPWRHGTTQCRHWVTSDVPCHVGCYGAGLPLVLNWSLKDAFVLVVGTLSCSMILTVDGAVWKPVFVFILVVLKAFRHHHRLPIGHPLDHPSNRAEARSGTGGGTVAAHRQHRGAVDLNTQGEGRWGRCAWYGNQGYGNQGYGN